MLYFWVFGKLESMEKHPIELHGNWEWGIALGKAKNVFVITLTKTRTKR